MVTCNLNFTLNGLPAAHGKQYEALATGEYCPAGHGAPKGDGIAIPQCLHAMPAARCKDAKHEHIGTNHNSEQGFNSIMISSHITLAASLRLQLGLRVGVSLQVVALRDFLWSSSCRMQAQPTSQMLHCSLICTRSTPTILCKYPLGIACRIESQQR